MLQLLGCASWQMFLLKSRTDIAYRADDIDPWYYVWVWYGGDLAGMYMEWAGFTDDVLVLDCHVDPMEFMTVVKEMLERPRLELSSELFRKGQAFRFLSLAVLSHEKATQNQHKREDLTVDDYVDYAVKYIRANYSHLRIADVAEYIGISRSYFTEIFHRKMLMSPQEYLMQVRMNRARELLEETQLSVAVVAGSVGYEDQLAFSKIFRKKTGMSPEQYRKKQRNEHSL